ncbi:hypothetical protein RB653_004189 [Dictyostelium firmibasis]|uniref:DOMON domain-containing protein n=1 Tax=Dictyostelium firmibasis TaxID=79012 RepID=A0AAN7YS60_9MYCE
MIKSIVFFIVLSSIFLVGVDAQFQNSVILDQASNYNLQWIIFNDTVTFQVSINKKAWIGLGWHCQGCADSDPMANADYNIATFDDNGKGYVWDCLNDPTTQPQNDTFFAGAEDNIISFSGYQTDQYSIMMFSKKLSTGDTIGDRILVEAPTDFIWAHGTDNSFAYHGVGNAGRITVNLKTGELKTGPDYVNWHASLMLVAFGLLMPFSIFSARFLKVFHWWWPLHYVFNGLASVCALIGFIIAIVMLDGLDFSTLHSIFGIITLSLVLVSILFGALSHFLWKPTRVGTPIFPDMFHWFVGRCTFALSIAAIITGMVLHQVPNAVIIVFSGVIGLYFGVVVFIEIYKRVYPNHVDFSHGGATGYTQGINNE